tara:strand:+ start:7989 stop:8756 length:768 start_codon:yes stop_codon:yes gene_type:complete
MKEIQLYGLFRTGTCYFAKLVESNFFVKIHHEGDDRNLNSKGFCTNWKHGPYVGHLLKEEFPMVIVTKSPYSWLVSCYNYWRKFPLGPELDNFTFEQFVKASPCCLEGSATVPFMFRAKNLMQYYWNANYHWTSVRSTEFFVMQYEAMLEDAEKALTQLAECFDLEPRGEFKNIEKNVLWNWRTMLKGDDHHNQLADDVRDQNFDSSHYKEKKYLDYYNDDLLKYVKNEWDIELGNKLAYRSENPTYFEKLTFPQ